MKIRDRNGTQRIGRNLRKEQLVCILPSLVSELEVLPFHRRLEMLPVRFSARLIVSSSHRSRSCRFKDLRPSLYSPFPDDTFNVPTYYRSFLYISCTFLITIQSVVKRSKHWVRVLCIGTRRIELVTKVLIHLVYV